MVVIELVNNAKSFTAVVRTSSVTARNIIEKAGAPVENTWDDFATSTVNKSHFIFESVNQLKSVLAEFRKFGHDVADVTRSSELDL